MKKRSNHQKRQALETLAASVRESLLTAKRLHESGDTSYAFSLVRDNWRLVILIAHRRLHDGYSGKGAVRFEATSAIRSLADASMITPNQAAMLDRANVITLIGCRQAQECKTVLDAACGILKATEPAHVTVERERAELLTSGQRRPCLLRRFSTAALALVTIGTAS